MTFSKPSTILNQTGAYTYKKGVSNSSTNYIDNNFPNILDKTGDSISGAITLLSGSSLTLNTGAVMDLNGTSVLAVNNSAEVIFNNTSTLELNDTSTMITGGSTQMLIGGTLNITSGGTFHLKSTGTMHIESGATETVDSGGVLALSSGATETVAGGANVNYASGANLNLNSGSFMTATSATTTFNGNLVIMEGGVTQIFNNGSSSFLTIGTGCELNIHGLFKTDVWGSWNTPQTRQSCMTIDYSAAANGAANWLNVGSGAGLQNTNSASPQIVGQQTLEIPLQRLHNGSTLASVFIAFIVGTSHTGVPANLPTFTVYRSNTLSNPTSVQYLNTVAVQSPANPGSGAAWYNSGNVQYYQYITNQHNVIDNTNYTYWMSVADESGTNSLGGNFYCSVTAENQIINDQSWNI